MQLGPKFGYMAIPLLYYNSVVPTDLQACPYNLECAAQFDPTD